jgi:hypothetical protein
MKQQQQHPVGSIDVSGKVCIFIVILIAVYFVLTQIAEGYKKDDPKLSFLRVKLRALHPDAVDRITILEDNRSYTINKKKIYMCLRDENGEYYDDNMLLFVAIHELAHVLCDEIGHTDKFQSIFQDLLQQAIAIGIYNPDIEPVYNYCEY